MKYILALLLTATLLLQACKSSKESSKALSEPIPTDAVAARVLDMRGLDGCTFLIQLEDSTKLEPTSLPEEFRVDKLNVWVNYRMAKSSISICMVGKRVDILHIQKRK